MCLLGTCLLGSCLLVGCESGPPMAPVSGRVTFNGKPLEFGTVMFQLSSGGQPARGQIQSDGTFELGTFAAGDGAIVGEHKVRITSYSGQAPGKSDEASAGGGTLGQLLIPKRYTMFGTSKLTATVKPDGNEPFEFDLTAK